MERAESEISMAKRSEEIYSKPLSFYAWQRLKKNKLAMFGLFIIALSVIVAILGYHITPDPTPFSNDQKLEIKSKPPGFIAKVLLIRKNELKHESNFFSKMIFGKENDFKEAVYFDYTIEGNTITYEEYTGNKINNGTKIKYNMADVLYAIDYDKPFVDNADEGYVSFYDMELEEQVTRTTDDIRANLLTNNLKETEFKLGTDIAGRDMLSRIIIGTRISLGVGFISVFISIFIGVLLGAIAGYYRGWVDDVIMWVINVVWSIPALLLVIAITMALGKGVMQVFIAVGLTMWVEVARVIRGQVLSLREKEFIEAGRSLGFSNFRIIFNHIIPNVSGPVIVLAAANFANAILIEAGLSFLGIGAQPPTPSWGAIISTHRGFVISDNYYLAFVPGLAIMLMVLAFIMVGNGLRDALDAKSIDETAV